MDTTLAVQFFTLEKWSAVGALGGPAALQLLDASFDAVVLDLKMPTMQGDAVLARIRERPDLDSVCVVILTAYGAVGSAVQCLRQGAYQYLEKPFQLQDLGRILISGIALQKAHALRTELLATGDPDIALEAIRCIVRETVNPDGFYVIFLNPDGSVERLVGGDPDQPGLGRRRFVTQIVETRRPLYERRPDEVSDLQPVNPSAKSLLAAPVPAGDRVVAGILYAESTEPNAFDWNWVEVISYLADMLGVALQARRLLEAERKSFEAERKRWQDIPIIVNELRHHISTPAQVIAMQAREFASKELRASGLSKLPRAVAKGMSRRINVIRRNADAIKRVCSYLKDVSNEIPLNKQRFNLVTLVNACAEEVKTELKEKHVRLTVRGKPKGVLMLEADPNLVKYCLQCLLRNSIEAIEERRNQELRTDFDPAKAGDGIAIQIDDGIAGRVSVSVEDTGIGIARENREKVFQPLFSTKQRPEPGGMGLFGVRRIMNNHEGTVSFESQPGKGATFTLSFPRK